MFERLFRRKARATVEAEAGPVTQAVASATFPLTPDDVRELVAAELAHWTKPDAVRQF